MLIIASLVLLAGTMAFLLPWQSLQPHNRYTSAWFDLDQRIQVEAPRRAEPIANIVIDVRSIRPAEREMDVVVITRFYQHNFSTNLVDGSEKPFELPSIPVDDEAYPKMQLTIFPSFFAEPTYVEIPISSDSETNATIALDTSPQAFPNDRYDLDEASAILELPLGMFYRVDEVAPTKLVNALSFGIALSQGPNLVDWRVRPGYALSHTSGAFRQIADLGGTVRRPLDYEISVYSIACTPLLLGLAVAVQNRRRKDGAARPSLELAAALFALLPLRQVLVPTDIPGFTRLDRLLAVEIVAIIALIILPIALPARAVSNGRDQP